MCNLTSRYTRIYSRFLLYAFSVAVVCLGVGELIKVSRKNDAYRQSAGMHRTDTSHDEGVGNRQDSFTFGVIADIQYADHDNGRDYSKTRIRYYRHGLMHLRAAREHWGSRGDVSLVLQLGDLLDGCNTRAGVRDQSMQEAHRELDQYTVPVYHVWGNHEFYNYRRAELLRSPLRSAGVAEASWPSQNANYYSLVHGDYRIVVLDTFEFSVLGYDPRDREYQLAHAALTAVNRNRELNSPQGLPEGQTHMVKFNGGVSRAQLAWLDAELREADTRRQHALVVGHVLMHPHAGDKKCLCWNYKDVLRVLHAHHSVVAYFCGHDHDGGYTLDEHGVHHVTFHGVVEAPPDKVTFATVTADSTGRIIITGNGTEPSRVLPKHTL